VWPATAFNRNGDPVLDTLQARQVASHSRRSVPILGACLELGAASPGALMGPQALRTAGIARVLADLGHAVSDRGTLHEVEAVAVEMAPADAARCRHLGVIAGWTRRIHDYAYAMAENGAVPLVLGGDHAISMGSISGVARRCREQGRELAVLWLDAHADYNTPATSPSGNMHGMALAFLAGEPSLRPILASRPFYPIAPGDIHVFGARSIDPGEKARLIADGVDAVDMRQIDERGVSALLAERIERWRSRGVHLHVSFDVDFLDPAVAPGTGTVVPGGATYREAHLVMEMLCDSGLVGSVDLVELNPFLDERGRTAVTATELVASLFGRTVLDRRPGAVSAA
jgi:arginase